MKNAHVEKPEVSVVVAAHNVAKTIRACVDSIVEQKGAALEVICVDNDSTDGTSSILDECAANDGRIRVIHNPRNVGLLESRHVGVQVAQGEFLLFVDGDDELLPDGLAKAVQEIRRQAVDVIVFGLDFNVVGEVHLPSFQEYFRLKGGVDNTKPYPLLRACFLNRSFSWNSWNKIYRTTLVLQAMAELKGDCIVQGEDVYLSFLIGVYAKSGAVLNEPVYRYRIGNGLSTDAHMSLANLELYLAYVMGLRRLADFVASRDPHPIVDAAFMQVVDNARRVMANVVNNRLAPEYREQGRERLKAHVRKFKLEGVLMTEIANEEILRQKIRQMLDQESQPFVKDWERRITGLQQELDDLKRSASFRIGKLITFPFRKARRLIWGK